jgi:biopolymer transport protein ExbB/TolQ
MSAFFEFLRDHFFHAAPILVAGVLAAAIVLDRARLLYITYPLRDIGSFFDRLAELTYSGKMDEAIALCDRFHEKPAARVVKQALVRATQPEELIRNNVEIAVNESVQTLQKRTSFLAMLANVATLLGLFGTIAGLIASFEAVGQADPQQKSALLAAGISAAMNATLLGLAVAIPSMVAFSFLVHRQNELIAEVDQAAIRAMDLLRTKILLGESVTGPRATLRLETPPSAGAGGVLSTAPADRRKEAA